MNKALDRAIKKAGGVTRLARAVGVQPNVVSNWRMRGTASVAMCPAIERATGERCDELRPDVDWTRDASGEVIGYRVHIEQSAA